MATQLHREPYPYMVTDEIMDEVSCTKIRQKLEQVDAWELVSNDLLKGFRFAQDAATVLDPVSLEGFDLQVQGRAIVAGFGAPLADEIKYSILRQIEGHHTDVHSDFPLSGRATHRAVLYLNRHGIDYEGGEFNVHSTQENICATYNPKGGSIIAFEAGVHSYHSVSPILSGERVVIQLFFYHVGAAPSRFLRIRNDISVALDRLSEREQRQLLADIEDLVARYIGRVPNLPRLCGNLRDVGGLLMSFGLDLEGAVALIGEKLRRRALVTASFQPNHGYDWESEEAPLLVWAWRLTGQLESSFTAERWARDVALFQQGATGSAALDALLAELYPAAALLGVSH